MTTPGDHYKPFPSFADCADSWEDTGTLARFVDVLEDTKRTSTPETLAAAVERATKMAAIDTGAIEGLYEVNRGFTMTVALEAAAWENIHLEKGEKVQRAIHDALAGYDYVLDLATSQAPITEVWIKQLHTILCAAQDTYTVWVGDGFQEQTLPKGQYKAQPNSPLKLDTGTPHHYAPPADTPAEMQRLVDELRSPAFEAASPILQAAYAHYAFVCIHPFSDGNGRVARALASAFLYRTPGVPLIIFADQKAAYLDALEAADAGHFGAFARYIEHCAIDAVQVVSVEMRRPAGPSFADKLAGLQSSLIAKSGLSHVEVDNLAKKLEQMVADTLVQVVGDFGFVAPLSADVSPATNLAVKIPDGLRSYPNSKTVQFKIVSQRPAYASVDRLLAVAVARPEHVEAEFVIVTGGKRQQQILTAFVRELHPLTTAALEVRLKSALEHQVNELASEAIDAAQQQLRQAGYSPST